jgi:hypothetical protein
VAVFLVLVGATAGYAAWTAAVAKSASVTAGTAATTSTGLASLSATYKPGLPGVTAAVLSDTAPVSVTNTGSAPLAYGLTSTGGDATLNPQITLQVWSSTAAACTNAATVPGTATSGTLAAPPALPADANAAAAGAVLSLCFRTSITGAYTAAGGLTTTPTIAVVGTVGSNWTASSAVAFTQVAAFNWYQLVHKFSAKCMDANGGNATNNTTLILYPCKAGVATNSNQSFRFAQVGTTAFYRIYIGAGAATGPVVTATTNIVGTTTVQLSTLVAGDTTTASQLQQWSVVQHGTAGDFRIVQRSTGGCLTMANSNDLTQFTVTACDATATAATATTSTAYRAQHFTFTEIAS